MDNNFKSKCIGIITGNGKPDKVLKNAHCLNVFTSRFERKDIAICDDIIIGVGEYDGAENIDCTDKYIVPGFIDAHVHLESSAVSPYVFAKEAVLKGTTCVITDPHEIVNVMGCDGLEYMMSATEGLPVDVFFMIPSCVPASPFDENGADITSEDVKKYINNDRVLGLAEMMNFPGVLAGDVEILKKIEITKKAGKRVDGHAPGLFGNDADAYALAGVESDHECTDVAEAIETLSKGQWLMVREGTASKNLENLIDLVAEPYASKCMFVTDDNHIDNMMKYGYIDHIIKKAIRLGAKPETAYKIASHTASLYFGLEDRGAIVPGRKADLVILDDYKTVDINMVMKNGKLMTRDTVDSLTPPEIDFDLKQKAENTMHVDKITADDIKLDKKAKIIGLLNHQIVTTDEGEATAIDVDNDILKLCVIERHKNTGHKGICYLKGYGLKSGAVATSVAHDSHNIIVVGTNDEDIACAVNEIINMQGGMVVVNNGEVVNKLPLAIAGLMSKDDALSFADNMSKMRECALGLGVNPEIDPFMTLSFVSLPVIPTLKLTTLGVVDVNKFELI